MNVNQFVMGVRPPVYWLSNLIVDTLVYWIPVLIFFVLFAIAGYTTIVGVNFAAAFLLFAGAIFATLSFNYLISFLFDKYNTIISYAIGINVLVGLVIAVGTGVLQARFHWLKCIGHLSTQPIATHCSFLAFSDRQNTIRTIQAGCCGHTFCSYFSF